MRARESNAALIWRRASIHGADRCGFKNVPLRGEPDHDDVRDEILDVLHSLDAFTSAIRAKKKSPADVLALARALQKEIDDVVEQYRREW